MDQRGIWIWWWYYFCLFVLTTFTLSPRRIPSPWNSSVNNTGSARAQKSVSTARTWKGVWEEAQSRKPVRELNSQFLHLLYSVMFQHELDGTLESGAFEESFFTQRLFTKVRYRSTTRQGSVKRGLPQQSCCQAQVWKEGREQMPGCRRSPVAPSPGEKSAQGISQRGHQENIPLLPAKAS